MERIMVAPSPTAYPSFGFKNRTAFSLLVKPEGRTVQYFPPELVNRIFPRPPTAHPWELSMKKMSDKSSRPPSVNRRQERPPSSVRTTRPSAPPAQPTFSLAKCTVVSFGLVRTFAGNQSVPPSPVIKTTPLSPEAQPCVSSVKTTEKRSVLTNGFTDRHVAPPSSVISTVPW